MAIAATFVKGQCNNANVGTTVGVTTPAIATFVIFVADNNPSVVVSDIKGNTYAQAETDLAVGANVVVGQAWVCQRGTGGAGHTFTVTFTGAAATCAFYAAVVTGEATSSPLDVIKRETDTSAPTFTTTTAALAQAAEIALLFAFHDGSGTPFVESTGFGTAGAADSEETDAVTYWLSAVWKKTVAATTALSPSVTVTGSAGDGMGLIVLTFKEAGAAGGGVPRFQGFNMMMGNNN